MNAIQHLEFASFSQVIEDGVDVLAKLHNIRDRRPIVSNDSPYRMLDVCNRAPQNLPDADVESFGYHRGRY